MYTSSRPCLCVSVYARREADEYLSGSVFCTPGEYRLHIPDHESVIICIYAVYVQTYVRIVRARTRISARSECSLYPFLVGQGVCTTLNTAYLLACRQHGPVILTALTLCPLILQPAPDRIPGKEPHQRLLRGLQPSLQRPFRNSEFGMVTP